MMTKHERQQIPVTGDLGRILKSSNETEVNPQEEAQLEALIVEYAVIERHLAESSHDGAKAKVLALRAKYTDDPTDENLVVFHSAELVFQNWEAAQTVAKQAALAWAKKNLHPLVSDICDRFIGALQERRRAAKNSITGYLRYVYGIDFNEAGNQELTALDRHIGELQNRKDSARSSHSSPASFLQWLRELRRTEADMQRP